MNAQIDDKQLQLREWLMARAAELRERITRIQQDLRHKSAPLPQDAPDAAILIEYERLRVVPYATFCRRCAQDA